MRMAVSFTTVDGRCAITGRGDPMDFVVPIPEGMDAFEGSIYAVNEVARVRRMSPRELPNFGSLGVRIVADEEPVPESRPALSAVPDRSDS